MLNDHDKDAPAKIADESATLTFQNVGLLRFAIAVMRCEENPALYLSNESGFDDLEAAIAISIGRELGVLESGPMGRSKVTPRGRDWVRSQLSQLFGLRGSALLAVLPQAPVSSEVA